MFADCRSPTRLKQLNIFFEPNAVTGILTVQFFDNLRLAQKLFLSYLIPVAAIVLSAILVFLSINSLAEANRWVNHTHKVIGEGRALLASMIDMETGMRGYLVSGKDEFLEPYVAGNANFDEDLKDLKLTVSDNPVQVERLGEIQRLKDAWIKTAAEPQIAMRREVIKGQAAATEFKRVSARIVGKQKFDAFRAAIASVQERLTANNDVRAQLLLQSILLDMVNKETGQRGFLLTGLEVSLEPFNEGQIMMVQHMKDLRAHLETVNYPTSSILTALNEAEIMADDWVSQAALPEIEARRAMNDVTVQLDDIVSHIEKGAGKQTMDNIRKEIADFVDMEQALIETRSAEAAGLGKMTITVIAVSAVIAAFLVSLIGYLIASGIMRQVGGEPMHIAQISRRIADGDLKLDIAVTGKETGIYAAMIDMLNSLKSVLTEVRDATTVQSTATENLNTIADETNRNIQDQQNAINMVAAAVEQMQVASGDVASSTSQSASSANQATALVTAGNQKAKEVSAEIGDLSKNISQTTESIEELSNNAKNISTILDVIRNIADQTNLLALNAAIEAARAGDQGRGFAVVADEVRSLAQNTQDSTAEIEAMITKVQGSAVQSVNAMNAGRDKADKIVERITDVTSALDEIMDAVHNITDMTNQISSAADEQHATSGEISNRAVDIKELSEKTSSSTTQITESVAELTALAKKLGNEVARFRL